jgi:hypothetical protein
VLSIVFSVCVCVCECVSQPTNHARTTTMRHSRCGRDSSLVGVNNLPSSTIEQTVASRGGGEGGVKGGHAFKCNRNPALHANVVAISDDTIVVAHHKLTILSLHATNNIGSLIINCIRTRVQSVTHEMDLQDDPTLSSLSIVDPNPLAVRLLQSDCTVHGRPPSRSTPCNRSTPCTQRPIFPRDLTPTPTLCLHWSGSIQTSMADTLGIDLAMGSLTLARPVPPVTACARLGWMSDCHCHWCPHQSPSFGSRPGFCPEL